MRLPARQLTSVAALAALLAPAATTGARPRSAPLTVTQQQEPPVAPPAPKPAGARNAPPSSAGPLRFNRIQVRRGPDGRFAGQANVTNTGASYLDKRRVRWRIVDRHGARLDGAVVALASLAPGATTTISLKGSNRFRGTWRAVRFSSG